MATENLRTRLETLDTWQEALLFGDAALNVPGSLRRNERQDELNFGDACNFMTYEDASEDAVWSIPEGRDRDCRLVADGVFTKGLKAAFSLFVDTTRTLREQLLTVAVSDSNITRIRELAQSEAFYTINLMERTWLSHGLHTESGMYLKAQVQDLKTLMDVRTIMLAVFLALLTICYFFIYDPLVASMDIHLKRVRGLLVMVPLEIAQTTPSLRKLLFGTSER